MKFQACYLEKRIAALRSLLEREKADAFIITSRENNRFFANFSGTTSTSVVTRETARIYVDSRYTEQAKEQCLGYEVILVTRPLATAVEDLKKENLTRIAIEEEDVCVGTLRQLEKLAPEFALLERSTAISELRFVKDEYEIEQLRKAAELADQAYLAALKMIKVGMRECEVAAFIENHMRMNGASSPSFETIVASGYRSAMPHGVASDKKIEYGDPVTIDFGCIYNGYCSDTTRSFFAGTPREEEMVKIYNIVLRAQLAGVEQIHAGMTGKQGDAVARDIIAAEGYGPAFGHSLGHSTGLLIHEFPSLSPNYEGILPENSMITVEPGIYVPGLGGIRIEDSCLVKKDGLEAFNKTSKELLVLDC